MTTAQLYRSVAREVARAVNTVSWLGVRRVDMFHFLEHRAAHTEEQGHRSQLPPAV